MAPSSEAIARVVHNAEHSTVLNPSLVTYTSRCHFKPPLSHYYSWLFPVTPLFCVCFTVIELNLVLQGNVEETKQIICNKKNKNN